MPDEHMDPKDLLVSGGAFEALPAMDDDYPVVIKKLIGRTLGEYTITDVIAEGGMGVVFRGVRSDGSFDREVAIKVSIGGSVSKELNERFLREREILASLSHSNISQLFDAGITEEGWPYFVMELVDGQQLTEYCHSHDLAVEQSIDLLIQVVDAVAYAHARLIVHRDIKPSNILIDRDGRPKLLDFGIAKMLIPGIDYTTALPMTPMYASPEQLLGQPVTIASDIYQVGLLMLDIFNVGSAHAERDLESLIRDASAGKDITLSESAAKHLQRDVRMIIECCLRADPELRYSDANALRKDLKAYREGFALDAVGPSVIYRLGKFVQRNRLATITGSIAIAAMIGGSIFYTLQVQKARDDALFESRTSQRTTQFLIDTFRAGEPGIAQGNEVTVEQLLEAGADRVENELREEPDVQARLYGALSNIQLHRGQYAEAKRLAEKAIDHWTAVNAPPSRESVWLMRVQVESLSTLGEDSAAVELALEAIALHERHLDPDDELLRDLWRSLAVSRQHSGDIEGARQAFAELLNLQQTYGAADFDEEVRTMVTYSAFLNVSGDSVAAEELLVPVYPRAKLELGPGHPLTLSLATNLGHALYVRERFDDAVPLFTDVYAGRAETLGETHSDTLGALANLGAIQVATGQLAAGEQRLRQAAKSFLATLGEAHPTTILVRGMHSSALTSLGRYDESINLLTPLIALAHLELGAIHPYSVDLERILLETHAAAGNVDYVEENAEGVLQRHIELLGEDHSYTTTVRQIIDKNLNGREG